MSVIWQLPEDILHNIYSDWLEWKDLSMLDIACVEKSEREEWLTSLTDLRITRPLKYIRMSDNAVKIFYRWLMTRKTYNPTVQLFVPLKIEKWNINEHTSDDLSQIENNFPIFMSHCHNLQEVTIRRLTYPIIMRCNDMLLRVLVEKMRENSLVKIILHDSLSNHESHVLVATLLTKHASSLQHLKLCFTEGNFSPLP
eukprot:scaffold3486_cov185-Ochromonas_danica.AAC.10